MSKKPKVVVIMPTYNESKNIGRMIEALVGEEFPKITEAEMHLLVVDDKSPDGTGEIVKKKMAKYPHVHLSVGEKQGLGMAYVRGMRYAMDKMNAEATIEMDADFQHDPKYVKDLVREFVNGADYVIGSRYIKGGSIPKGWGLHRKALSFFGNLFARIVLWLPHLHDMTTGFRLTRVKGVLDQIDLEHLMELKRFAHKMDLFYQTVKLAKKVVEVPIHFAERKQEASKFSLKEMIASYKVVILLRIKASQRFIKFGIVGFIGYLVNAIGLRILTVLNAPGFIAWSVPVELAIISNFTLNNLWTFRKEKITGLGNILRKFLEFNGTSAGALVIQTLAGNLGDLILGKQYRQIILPFIILFLVLPYNYFMYNAIIWRTWKIPIIDKLLPRKKK